MKRCVTGIITLILCAAVVVAAPPLRAAPPDPSGPLAISEIETGGCTVSVTTATCPSTGSNHLGEEEFVELYNTGAVPFTVRGWTLEYITGGGTATALAALNGTLTAGGYLLIAHAGAYPAADLTFGVPGDGGKLAATSGYVALADDHGVVTDAVGWGSGLNVGSLAGWPVTPSIPYGESASRIFPGSPLYTGGQVFAAPSWQLSPQGGNYTPALPIDTIAPQPALPLPAASPLIITALRMNGGVPIFVQLYNNSGAPLDLRRWQLTFDAHDTATEVSVTLAAFASWLAPHGYAVVGDGTIAADISFSLGEQARTQLAALPAASLSMLPPAGTAIPLDLTAMPPQTYGQWLQRLQTGSGKYAVTGAGSDFTAQNGAASLDAGGLYEPPETAAGLEIVEILPHAPDCSPLDPSRACNDYIKLFNASTAAIDLSGFHLRSDSGGLQPAAGNTIPLSGLLAPGTYRLISTRSDGDPLSLTDSGGYVWLEDAYGVRIYEPVVQYPGADAEGRTGWTWALDGTTWRWSSHPSPDGPNVFPSGDAVSGNAAASPLLQPCTPDQYRNPATNRCRSLVTAAAALQPCQLGQERNPATNRCRAVLAASTSLKPCPAGQTRNPETNRCHTSTASTIASVADVAAPASARSSLTPWLITGAIAAVAAAYAAYEWRQDLLLRYAQLRAVPQRIIAGAFRRFRRKPGR